MFSFRRLSYLITAFIAVLILMPINPIIAIQSEDYLVKVSSEDTNVFELGLDDINLPKELKSKDLHLWKKATNVNPQELKLLKNNPDVLDVQKEINYKVAITPNDPKYNLTGNLYSGEYDQWNLRKIGLMPVETPSSNTSGWEISTGSSSTIVAVIDTGIDLTHPDLLDNIWVNTSEFNGTEGVDDDLNGYVDDINGYNFYSDNTYLNDILAHGTHVSGTIAAVSNNNTGIAGICWSCKIMPLKVFETVNSTSDIVIAEAINYAVDNGANVINMSISGQGYSPYLQDAVDYAWDNNVIVVAAAGNDALDASLYTPAGLRNVITVGATDRNDVIGGFSNIGPKIDLTAPGVYVLSTRLRSLGAGGCLNESDYFCLSGTSMAAPHVSGVAALIYDYHRGDLTPWSNIKIRAAMLKSIDDKGSAGFDNVFGFGRLNALTPLQLSELNLQASIPVTTLNSLTNDYFSQNINLSGTVTSNDLFMYNLIFNLSGNTVYTFTGRGNKSNSTLINQNIQLQEGTYSVVLSGEDFNGSVNDSTPLTIHIDTTPPLTFSVTTPTDTWTNQQTHTFNWNPTTDASGQPITYNLTLDNVGKISDISSTSYSLIETLSEGTHSWYATAKDKAGNLRNTAAAQLRIDITQPTDFTISKAISSSSATFTFSTTDNLSGVNHYEISINNELFATIVSPYTTATLPNGAHSVRIKAVDNAGNTRTVEDTFTIDSRFYMLKSVGDLSGDGTVELSDLSILATYWRTSNDNGDVNHDGVVDISDLSILAQHWHQNF